MCCCQSQGTLYGKSLLANEHGFAYIRRPRGMEMVLLESMGCYKGAGGIGRETWAYAGLMKVLEADPYLLPGASMVVCGMVCVCNTVGSLEWESPAWQPSVWVGFALRSRICLFSGPVSVLIYTKKMKVKTLTDESSVHVPAPASVLTTMAAWWTEDISKGKLRAPVNNADALIWGGFCPLPPPSLCSSPAVSFV